MSENIQDTLSILGKLIKDSNSLPPEAMGNLASLLVSIPMLQKDLQEILSKMPNNEKLEGSINTIISFISSMSATAKEACLDALINISNSSDIFNGIKNAIERLIEELQEITQIKEKPVATIKQEEANKLFHKQEVYQSKSM